MCGPVSSQQACRLAGSESLDSLESRALSRPTHSFFLPKRPVPLDPVPRSSCPRRGTYPLRQKLCLCRNSVSFAWRKGARILSPAPHGAPTSVLRRIRFRGTGCFALPLRWCVTRWFADGGFLILPRTDWLTVSRRCRRRLLREPSHGEQDAQDALTGASTPTRVPFGRQPVRPLATRHTYRPWEIQPRRLVTDADSCE